MDASKTVFMERLMLVTRFPDKAGFRFSSIFAFDRNVSESALLCDALSLDIGHVQIWLLILASLFVVASLSFLFNAATLHGLLG